MAITYIMCIAGEGTRFQPIFGSLPKPLIKLKGRTMLEWSLQSLPIMAEDRVVFISQKKHRIREKMEGLMADLYPFCSIFWHEIESVTRGQLETALLAEPYVLHDSSLVIYNCDTYFQSKYLLSLFERDDIDGIIPCAKAEGDSWSFCETDAHGNVVDIKEKERISDWATVGLYHFKDSTLFFEGAKEQIEINASAECYVAPFYKKYILAEKKIVMDRVHLFKPMGSPEQLRDFWQVDAAKLKAENDAPVLVIDLDGTITIDDPAVPYSQKAPNLPVIEKMREFHAHGWKLIIHTSRRMKTHNNDEASIIAEIGMITQEWLVKHDVPYHGLKFGKPYAHNGFYVDDKAMSINEFLRHALEGIIE